MLIFATLLSATGQPFISKALGLTLGKNIKKVKFVFWVHTLKPCLFACSNLLLSLLISTASGSDSKFPVLFLTYSGHFSLKIVNVKNTNPGWDIKKELMI